MTSTNPKFEIAGVNHLAPVCRDMKETVDFYHGILGMPVTLTTQWGAPGREQQIFFFDIGAIAAALYHRERTQEGCVIDVSLLGAALWASQGTNVGACLSDSEVLPAHDRRRPPNPLVNTYRTRDGRFIMLGSLQADRYWPRFCEAIGRPDLLVDARFAEADARRANIEACVQLIDAAFAEEPLEHWVKTFKDVRLPFGIIQTPREAQHDVQARLNGFIQDLTLDTGLTLPVTIAPAVFDEEPPVPTPAPHHATNTDEVLAEVGYSADQIMALRIDGAIT
jgi:crotonobetainyl-CoA:carnitine CoA-transferase CaiB-like acyl-CoA transferase